MANGRQNIEIAISVRKLKVFRILQVKIKTSREETTEFRENAKKTAKEYAEAQKEKGVKFDEFEFNIETDVEWESPELGTKWEHQINLKIDQVPPSKPKKKDG